MAQQAGDDLVFFGKSSWEKISLAILSLLDISSYPLETGQLSVLAHLFFFFEKQMRQLARKERRKGKRER